ncbi:MAG: hypothetical protein MUW57_07275 [Pseudomonas sp.]|nr:hypothetical protein [Pseudomonas sp.]
MHDLIGGQQSDNRLVHDLRIESQIIHSNAQLLGDLGRTFFIQPGCEFLEGFTYHHLIELKAGYNSLN